MRKRSGTKVKVFGREFISLREACRFYGFNIQTIDYRIKHGMSLEEAFSIHEKLTHYQLSPTRKRIKIDGKLLTDIAKETGKKYNTVYKSYSRKEKKNEQRVHQH